MKNCDTAVVVSPIECEWNAHSILSIQRLDGRKPRIGHLDTVTEYCPAEESITFISGRWSVSLIRLVNFVVAHTLISGIPRPRRSPCVFAETISGHRNSVSYPPPKTPIKCRAFSQIPTAYLLECRHSIGLVKSQQALHILLVHLH